MSDACAHTHGVVITWSDLIAWSRSQEFDPQMYSSWTSTNWDLYLCWSEDAHWTLLVSLEQKHNIAPIKPVAFSYLLAGLKHKNIFKSFSLLCSFCLTRMYKSYCGHLIPDDLVRTRKRHWLISGAVCPQQWAVFSAIQKLHWQYCATSTCMLLFLLS